MLVEPSLTSIIKHGFATMDCQVFTGVKEHELREDLPVADLVQESWLPECRLTAAAARCAAKREAVSDKVSTQPDGFARLPLCLCAKDGRF